MHYQVGFATDIGRKRTQNQDRGAALPELGLFIVADGMGGHLGGETASSMVIETVPSRIRNFIKNSDGKLRQPKDALAQAILMANRSIYERSLQSEELSGMGTTTTALLFTEDTKSRRLTIAHVGDSRCYFLQPGAIWQLTHDHSLVQEKHRAGLITREQLRTDKMKNVITRSVGYEETLDVEFFDKEVKPGDVYLICSDGLSGPVDERKILSIIDRRVFQENNLELAAKDLIGAANQNGGDDNITLIIVKVLNGL